MTDHTTMQVFFPLPLRLETVFDGIWTLTDSFQVIVEEEGLEVVVLDMPTGFVTDLASVPRIPFAFLLFSGLGNKAGATHDYLYSRKLGGVYPREWCDAVFYAGLLAQGIERGLDKAEDDRAWREWKDRAWAMFQGVHRFGERFYNPAALPASIKPVLVAP